MSSCNVIEKFWPFKFNNAPFWSDSFIFKKLIKFEYKLNLAPFTLLYVINEKGWFTTGILQMIDLFDPNWLLILPVGKLDDTHIHCLGLKLAGAYDVKAFNADVLYKSFVEQPIKDKHVEYWLLIIKLFVELPNVYLPVMVEYDTVVRGKLDVKYDASCNAL